MANPVRDGSHNWTYSTSAVANFTQSITVPTAGDLVVAYFNVYTSYGGDVVTGVTIGGVSATRIKYSPYPGTSPRQLYCYALANVPAGACDIVVSVSPNQYIEIVGVCYKDAGLPDVSVEDHRANNSTPMTLSLTTISDNEFVAGYWWGEGTGTSASTGATSVGNNYYEYSSNPKTPAGSVSMTVNVANANNWPSLGIMVAIPYSAPASNFTPKIMVI